MGEYRAHQQRADFCFLTHPFFFFPTPLFLLPPSSRSSCSTCFPSRLESTRALSASSPCFQVRGAVFYFVSPLIEHTCSIKASSLSLLPSPFLHPLPLRLSFPAFTPLSLLILHTYCIHLQGSFIYIFFPSGKRKQGSTKEKAMKIMGEIEQYFNALFKLDKKVHEEREREREMGERDERER